MLVRRIDALQAVLYISAVIVYFMNMNVNKVTVVHWTSFIIAIAKIC